MQVVTVGELASRDVVSLDGREWVLAARSALGADLFALQLVDPDTEHVDAFGESDVEGLVRVLAATDLVAVGRG